MTRTTLTAALAVLALATQASGDTLESVTVTGSRLPQSTLATHAELSQEQIERVNAASTVDLLRQLPNLLISQNGGPSGHAFVSIRGSEPNFVLVLIDGVPVNDPTNSSGGGFDFNQLDPALIERVEVYRGGISAIHGGEAISGVIHFITRERASSSIGLEAGGDAQRRASLTLASGQNAPWSALLSVASSQESPSALADYENHQALLRLRALGDNHQHQLLLSGSATRRSSLAEDSGGSSFAVPQEPEHRDSEQLLASWASEFQAGERHSLHTRLSWSRHQEDIDNPGIRDGVLSGIPPSDIRSEYRKAEGESYLRWTPTAATSMLAGLNARHARGENQGNLDYGFPVPVDFSLTQEIYGVFVEGALQWEAATLEAGVRHDAPSGFDGETSARLNLNYALEPSTRMFASYGEGYKLPSFFALGHPLVGNPALKPELSRNSELGLVVESPAGHRFQFSLFHNRYEDLVDFDAEQFTSVNRSEVTARGAEWQGALQLAEWFGLQVDVSYLDTEISDSDSRLRRRPQWSGGAQLNATLGTATVTLSAENRGDFWDSSVATGPVVLDGYTDVHLAAQWQISQRTQLSMNLDNLGDARMEPSVGFYQPGRRLRVGIRHQL